MVAQVVIKLALVAAQTALGAMRRIEGPRVDDLKVTSGDYGAPWPRVWGTRWISPPVIWAKDLEEVKQTRKTKGGKYNDYTYFGSWAHGLAIHPLEAVRRIKFDGHLVYDASGAGPITPFSLAGDGGKAAGGAGSAVSDYMRFYPGDLAQGLDPAIEADVDGRLGEGFTPAYRGRSYLVFDRLPLDKFGNRIPQVMVEVVSAAQLHYPWESKATLIEPPRNMYAFTFSADYSRFVFAQGQAIEMWDVAARGRMLSATLSVEIYASALAWGQKADGRFYVPGAVLPAGYNQRIYLIGADLGSAALVLEIPNSSYIQGGIRVCTAAGGTEHWLGIPWSNGQWFYVDGTPRRMVDLTGVDWKPCSWFADAAGSIWAAGRVTTLGVTTAYFYRMFSAPGASGPAFVTVAGLVANTGATTAACEALGAADGKFVLVWHTALYRIEPGTGAVLTSATGRTFDPIVRTAQVNNCPPGSSTVWLNANDGSNTEYSLTTLAVIRTVTLGDWKSELAYGQIFDPINHALICAASSAYLLTWRYLDRIGASSVLLSDVVEDVATLAGIDPADIDAGALVQTVPGYSVSGGSGKDWLEPLLDLYDVDPVPHGFQLKFLPRGAASDETIASSNFAAADDGALFTVTPENGATDLPQQVTLQYADPAIEQQPAAAMSPPLFEGDGQRTLSIDMSNLVLGADLARHLVARYARRQRFDATSYAHAVPLSRIDLEPGAVKVLDLAGVTAAVRLQSMVLDADRRIALEWRRDDPSVALLDGAAGAPADGHTPPVIAVPLLSKGFVLDLPLISDLDESANPVLLGGAAPYGDGAWPGATIYRALSGEYSDEVLAIEGAAMAVWGYTSAALPDPAGGPWLWDRLSTVEVVLQVGSLAGTTEAAINANPALNLALIGGELVQFASATLTATKTYTLSGFKRGRKGSEGACAGHAARETFVMLAACQAIVRPLSEVGTSQSYKAITAGRTEAGAFAINLAPFAGVSKKPYAPCQLTERRDSASGDWALGWVRRSRIGGAWTGGTPVPLGETAELYDVEILNGASVVRTISGLTSPAFTWTAAMQTTDFGSGQSVVSWRVYQISDVVGRGFAAAG